MSATKRTATASNLDVYQVDDSEEPSPRRKRVKRVNETQAVRAIPLSEDGISKERTSSHVNLKIDRTPASLASSSKIAPSVRESKSQRKSVAKAKIIAQKALAAPHPAPLQWEETFAAIQTMRQRIVAPVDTMGVAEVQKGETDPKNKRYATLVALMLSSQTKDQTMFAAISKLRTALGGSINIDAMIEADHGAIKAAIQSVSFFNKKIGYLKGAAVKLRDEFDSDVPKTAEDLCSLTGVGPKMAYLTLQIAWGLNLGIGVDVHIHRITNLLGWHSPKTKTPDQTRTNLEAWFPKHLHDSINTVLVGFGQVICTPTKPRCDMCELSTKGLCPSVMKTVKVSKNRREVVFSKTAEANSISPPKIEIALEAEVEQETVSVDLHRTV